MIHSLPPPNGVLLGVCITPIPITFYSILSTQRFFLSRHMCLYAMYSCKEWQHILFFWISSFKINMFLASFPTHWHFMGPRGPCVRHYSRLPFLLQHVLYRTKQPLSVHHPEHSSAPIEITALLAHSGPNVS